MVTEARFSQLAREALESGSAPVHFSALARETLAGFATPVRFSGLAREALESGAAPVRFSGLVRETLCSTTSRVPVPTGHMTWTGGTPTGILEVDIPSGALTWTGQVPTVFAGTFVAIPTGHMRWAGQVPTPENVPSPAFNWRATVISQYQVSPIILRLVELLNDYLDPAADLDAFFRLVWNVNTAVGWGLDNWGRIVGVGRVLHVSTGAEAFGWEEGGTTDYTGFGQAPFFGGGAVTDNFSLSDLNYRRLILAKAAANITDGSIPAINQILLSLFPGRGNCYATDGLDMTMTYTFEFALTPVEEAIVGQSGVLPKPVGVAVSVVTPP